MIEPLGADVAVLSSRLSLEQDGGYAMAVLSRLATVRRAGGVRPLLLTVDAAPPETHARAAAEAEDKELSDGPLALRNLFDEALADPSWLLEQAHEGGPTPGIPYREIRDAHDNRVLSLPVVDDPLGWHLTTAHIVVHSPGGDRVVEGFGALYVAWLTHVAKGLRAAAGDPERRLIVICESRQLGEVLDGWHDPRVRIVHTVHNSHLARPFSADAPVRDEAWLRWLERLDRFDLVLWPTHAQSREVSERFAHHVPFAAVPSAILPRPSSPTAARETGDVAVMACRLVDQKRLDIAIRVWEDVVRRRPRARLDIYGRGPLHDRLNAMIERAGLTESVRLRGHDDDVRSAMDRVRVFLSTSDFEGQGLSIVEALSSGLPVVSFDVRYGPAEIIGEGGILTPAGDVSAMAEAVVSLFEDEERWNRASAGARRAAERFTPEAVGTLLRSHLDAVLAHPAPRLCALAGA